MESRFYKRPWRAEAGMVHQNVTRRLAHRLENLGRCIAAGKVPGQNFDADAVSGLQFLSKVFQPTAVAGHQHQIELVRGKQSRQLAANSRGSAGDEGPLIHNGALNSTARLEALDCFHTS